MYCALTIFTCVIPLMLFVRRIVTAMRFETWSLVLKPMSFLVWDILMSILVAFTMLSLSTTVFMAIGDYFLGRPLRIYTNAKCNASLRECCHHQVRKSSFLCVVLGEAVFLVILTAQAVRLDWDFVQSPFRGAWLAVALISVTLLIGPFVLHSLRHISWCFRLQIPETEDSQSESTEGESVSRASQMSVGSSCSKRKSSKGTSVGREVVAGKVVRLHNFGSPQAPIEHKLTEERERPEIVKQLQALLPQERTHFDDPALKRAKLEYAKTRATTHGDAAGAKFVQDEIDRLEAQGQAGDLSGALGISPLTWVDDSADGVRTALVTMSAMRQRHIKYFRCGLVVFVICAVVFLFFFFVAFKWMGCENYIDQVRDRTQMVRVGEGIWHMNTANGGLNIARDGRLVCDPPEHGWCAVELMCEWFDWSLGVHRPRKMRVLERAGLELADLSGNGCARGGSRATARPLGISSPGAPIHLRHELGQNLRRQESRYRIRPA